MTTPFSTLKSIVVPDSQDIVVNGQPTASLMHFFNDFKKFVDAVKAYEEPVVTHPFVIQIASTEDGAAITTTETIPFDDTIPQITEGGEVQSLAFTPKAADSKVMVEWTGFVSANTSNGAIAALFRNDLTDALTVMPPSYNIAAHVATLRKTMDSWGTTEKTFSLRIGRRVTGTTAYIGSNFAGDGAKFDERVLSVLTITEYKNSA